MGRNLRSQQDFQSIRRLPFCYVCGRTVSNSDETNRDHVPPTSIFAETDREPALILRSHVRCNADQSQTDQAVGQLLGLIQNRAPNPGHNKLNLRAVEMPGGGMSAALMGFDVAPAIQRWLKGFHAALYAEPLPELAFFSTVPPFPAAHPDAPETPIPTPEVLPKFVEELKKNRATRSLDRLVCRNDKCRFECVWTRADNGTWICVYGLDLYGWIDLGDVNHFEPRGCVGMYAKPGGRVPNSASTSTDLLFPVENRSPYDPFGC